MSERIGALWSKTGKHGTWFGGTIEFNEALADKLKDMKAGDKIPIVVFGNTKKDKETQPDFNILLSKPREEVNQEPSPNEAVAPDDEDIPFS